MNKPITFSKTVHRLLISSILLLCVSVIFVAWSIVIGSLIAKVGFAILLVLACVCSVFWLERAEHEKLRLDNKPKAN